MTGKLTFPPTTFARSPLACTLAEITPSNAANKVVSSGTDLLQGPRLEAGRTPGGFPFSLPPTGNTMNDSKPSLPRQLHELALGRIVERYQLREIHADGGGPYLSFVCQAAFAEGADAGYMRLFRGGPFFQVGYLDPLWCRRFSLIRTWSSPSPHQTARCRTLPSIRYVPENIMPSTWI